MNNLSTFLFHFVATNQHTHSPKGHDGLGRYAGLFPFKVVSITIPDVAVLMVYTLVGIHRASMKTGADSLVKILLPCSLAILLYLDILTTTCILEDIHFLDAGDCVAIKLLPSPEHIFAVL